MTPETAPRRNRARYLVDLLFLALVFAGFEYGVRAVPFIPDFRLRTIVDAAMRSFPAAIIWIWLWFHGDSPARIGLTRPRNWLLAIGSGAGVAATFYFGVYLLERAGYHRDLSAFADIKGNLELTIWQTISVMISAGFVEEFIFRGFLFHRLAMLFGGSKSAWAIAAVLQAVVFGFAHTYQNPYGVLLTGFLGLVLAGVFVAAGRNLWVPVIAHAGYDAARTVAFYFWGIPPW